MNREQEEITVAQKVFYAEEKQLLQEKITEIDIRIDTERDRKTIEKETEQQRVTREQNQTVELQIANQIEDQKIEKEARNEIKLQDMEMEKNMVDANLLRHHSIELAKRAYAGKKVENMRITNLAENDPSSRVLTGMIQSYDNAR